MGSQLRQHSTMAVSREAIPAPDLPVQQHTLRPAGLAPLDALIATPDQPRGVLLYFPGFNTTLGPWEIAKCAHLAQVSALQVIVTEIPGMSRFNRAIPKDVRTQMLRGGDTAWAELNLAYIQEAMTVGKAVSPDYLQVLGYSTGCSLAVAALPVLATWGPIEGLNLVEPVAITQRNLAALQAHNLADLGRMPTALATNKPHDWVMAARRSQSREPSVRYNAVDLVAIAQVLSRRGLLDGMEQVEVATCDLVRGMRSSLCRRPDFDRLDQLLADQGVPGSTISVEGLGHQLWHSFPIVAQLAEALLVDPPGQ